MVDIGISSNIMSLPFHDVTWHSGTWLCTMTPSIDQTLHPFANLLPNWTYRFWPYGDLVYKLRRVKNESNFISSGSKIVKRLRRRQYDPEIIEKTIGLVLGPFTALYRSFIKRCTLTNKAVGTIWRALSKPPQRRQGPDPRPLWLLVGTPSAFGPELAYRLRVVQPTLMDVPIFLIYF